MHVGQQKNITNPKGASGWHFVKIATLSANDLSVPFDPLSSSYEKQDIRIY